MLQRRGRLPAHCLPGMQKVGSNPSISQLPQSLVPFAKWQKLDVHGMRSGGGELAQLAALSDSVTSHDFKLSTAACLLKQLVHMPALCSEESPS